MRPYTSSTVCGNTCWKCSSSCFSRYQEKEAAGQEEAPHDRLKEPPLAMKAGGEEGEMVTSSGPSEGGGARGGGDEEEEGTTANKKEQ